MIQPLADPGVIEWLSTDEGHDWMSDEFHGHYRAATSAGGEPCIFSIVDDHAGTTCWICRSTGSMKYSNPDTYIWSPGDLHLYR